MKFFKKSRGISDTMDWYENDFLLDPNIGSNVEMDDTSFTSDSESAEVFSTFLTKF